MSLALPPQRAHAHPQGLAVPQIPAGSGSLALLLVLMLLPTIASRFVLTEVFGLAFVLGTIALSLQFLAGYGGMVSLAQMTVAGIAGYMVAILGVNTMNFGLAWPWWIAIPLALTIAIVASGLIGFLAIRTAGIYTIMITLAIAAAFYYFAFQNYTIFNGYNGINGVSPPELFGIDWRQPVALYYLLLAFAAASYAAVLYVSRSTFGLALQGIRDNARRMEAIGFNVMAHRVAAYVFAGAIAAFGGVLLLWHNGRISPGTVGVDAAIEVLVIAVIGGLRRPIGPFIGALIYAVLSTFAMDIIEVFLGRERFKLVIGLGFLITVLFSPDGILGLWDRIKKNAGGRTDVA